MDRSSSHSDGLGFDTVEYADSDGNPRIISQEEFRMLRLDERVALIMRRDVCFVFDGRVVDKKSALQALRASGRVAESDQQPAVRATKRSRR